MRRESIVRTVGIGVATAVLTGIVMTMLGLDDGGGTFVVQTGGSQSGPAMSDGGYRNDYALSAPQNATMCQTAVAACPMFQPLPPGAACVCSGAFGTFPGIAR